MPGLALAVICAAIVLVPLAVWWLIRTSALLRVAGVDPQYVRTVPDRVRYTSMGAIVLLTATAATASLTPGAVAGLHGQRLAVLPAGGPAVGRDRAQLRPLDRKQSRLRPAGRR